VSEDIQIQAILEDRARALARVPDETDDGADHIELAVFQVGDEHYACDITRIREVRPADGVTRLPSLPKYWMGLANLRGTLFCVLDLGEYVGAPRNGESGSGEIAVVWGDDFGIGLRVDRVVGVRRVPREAVRGSLDGAAGLIAGVTDDLVSLIDLDVLFADPRIVVREEV
jgi:purine-binding chemotaxis protein CheW